MADNSASTSPARTRWPLRTLMAAGCPPTSGATRISVPRTTPTMGASALDGHSAYPPAATSTRMPAAMIARFLAMRLPPLDDERGHHCEPEIDGRHDRETTPVARHVPQAGAELVDARDPVDGEIRRKDMAEGPHPLAGDRARPGARGYQYTPLAA